jgi:hypothetical protein
MDTASTDQDGLRAQAVTLIRRRRGFLAHAAVYVVVDAVLWVTWAVGGAGLDGGIPWSAFVTSFWGIGVAAQAWAMFRRSEISDAQVDRELERMRVSP